MVKFISTLFLIALIAFNSFGQCPNTSTSTFCIPTNGSALVLGATTVACDMAPGEYHDITNLVAGNTYRFSFCNASSQNSPPTNYDSFMTVHGPGGFSTFNDNFCGTNSQVEFIAPASGTYRVLCNVSGNCSTSSPVTFTPLTVTLVNAPSSSATVTSINRASTNPTNAGSVNFTVTFSAGVSNLTAGNFSLSTTGTITGASVGTPTGSGTTWTVPVNTGAGDGTIRLNLANASGLSPSVTTPYTLGQVYDIDKSAPTIVISNPSSASASCGSITYTVNYTGANSISLVNGNVTLNITGNASATINVSGMGTSNRTITLDNISGNGTLGISIAANTAADAVGNNAAAAGPSTTFSVNSTAAPTGNASQTFCAGAQVSNLTATGTALKWYDAASNGNLLSSTTTLVNGTIYYASQTLNSCESSSRLTVTATVNPASIGGTVSSAQTICAATSPADLSLSGQTGSVVKWQKSADAAFSSPVDIVSTATTLTGATIGNLTTNTYFRAVVKSGVCAETNSASVLITVNPISVGGTVSSAQTICSGSSPADLSLTGQTGSVLKWQKSTDPAFSSPVDIVSTSTTLTSVTIGNLTTNTYFRAVVKSGVCAETFSGSVLIMVNPASIGGTVSSAQTICAATSPADLSLSGQTGSVLKWQKSTDPAFSSPVDIVSTATTLTGATIGNLTANTYFRAVVKSGVCSEAFSGSVLITINPASIGGTVSSAQTICSGSSPADLSLSGQTGNVLKWQKSADAAFSSPVDIVSTATTLTSATIGTLTANTYFRAVVKSGVCSQAFSDAVLITVNPVSVGGTVSAAQTICSGTAPADLSLSSQTGNVVKWQKSADPAFSSPVDIVSTSTTLTSATIGNLTANTYFRAVVKSGVCAETFSGSVLITVNPVSIGGTVSSAQTICTATSPADLSLSGQTGSVVKWQKSTDPAFSSPVDIASTATTLTSALIGNLTANTYFRAVVKSGVCAETNSASVLITVNPASIGGTVSSAQTICSGTTPADLSLSSQTGNVVNWQKSADAAFSSPVDITSTSATLTSVTIGNLTANTYFRAVVKSGVCAETNSASVLITVNPASIGGTVSSAQTICAGTAPADLVLSNHVGSVLNWQKSADAAFSSPVDIASTSATLTSATIGNLTANTYFRAVVKSGVCSETNSASVLITVNPASIGGTVSSAQTICSGTAPADLSLSGQTGNVLKWQKSADAAFSSPVDIVSTATTLTSATIGTLTANTYFRAVVKSGVCAEANSASVLITVNPASIGGTVSSAQTICSGTAPADLSLSGQTGSVVKWQKSADPAFSSPVDIVSTATTLTGATIGNLTANTYFRAVVISGVCAETNSALVLITVNPASIGGTVSSAQTICAATSPADLVLSNHVGSVLKWQKSTDAAFSSPVDIASTATTLTSALIGNLTANTYFRAVVKSGVCAETNSASVLITVNPASIGGTVSSAQTICAGTAPADLSLSGQTGNVLKWQKSADPAFSSPVDIVSTSTTLTGVLIGNLTVNTYFRAVVKSGVCAETNSASVLITVNPASIGGTVSSAQTICSGTAPADLSLSSQTGNVVKWQKSNDAAFSSPVDIVSTATTLTSATIGTLTANTYFRAVVKSGVCSEAFSDAALITILSPATPTVQNDTIVIPNLPFSLRASGCSGPNAAVNWYLSSDNSLVSMPATIPVAAAFYARCQQSIGPVSCLSERSANVSVKVIKQIFVNQANKALIRNGKSWTTAFSDLKMGLDTAALAYDVPVEVWVAKGTYKPGTTRQSYFTIPSGVKVYGGFEATETLLTQRNPKTHLTTLSGEIGAAAAGDNTHHVVVFDAANDQTRIDGFHIQRGYAEFFAGNQNTNLTPAQASTAGGGILALNKSKGIVSHCVISDNKATFGGGILLRDSSHLVIAQTILWGNEATFGGGVYMQDGSKPRFENVLIVSNKGLGGGLYVNASQPLLIHCTIASNLGTNGTAGGIFNANATTTLKNSILWGNSAPQSTNGSVITYSIVEGGFAGTGNRNANPRFVSASPSNLAMMTALGDYHLLNCSPAIDAANNPDGLSQDLDGNTRPFPSTVGIADMGAYESSGSNGSGPATLTLTAPITSETVLQAAGQITATNQVSGATVVYQGSQSVTLLPGFSAIGNSFQALIGDCQTAAVTGSEAQK